MELSEAWSAGVRAAGGFIFKNILWIAFSNVIRFVPLAFPAARSAIIHSLHFNSAHEFLSVAALTSHIYKMSSVNNGARWIFTSFSCNNSIISHNHLVADLISIVGTSDFVLGSVDRIFLLVNIPDILNCPTWRRMR